MKNKPTVLVILDGFGYRKEISYNAVFHAYTPHLDAWWQQYPHAILRAAGNAVGLPENYIGNSEVGHLTIGSGRVIKEPLTLLNEAIDNKSFFNNKILDSHLKKLKKTDATLHIMGLLSYAGVHSNLKHLYAFLQAALQHGIKKIVLHLFLDGRDTPPQSAARYLNDLEKKLKKSNFITIGSLHGRFYAMDRDKNWNRTAQSYATLTQEQPTQFHSWQEILDHYYAQGITDEFIPPTQLDSEGIIRNGDGIIFFNFRPDRARQLTTSFIQPNFDQFKVNQLSISFFITPTVYNTYLKTDTLLPTKKITNTLKEVLVKHGKTIFAIAETEKYAHITYFFTGGKEEELPGETRILIPSITTKNYVSYPEMSAYEITKTVLNSLQKNPCDFYLINYANADMVGHSGNFDATVQAIECLDNQLEQLYEQIIGKMNGTLYITADHGNAEDMYHKDIEQPHTAHTTNPVPFIMIRQNLEGTKKLPLHELADIAPFILQNMNLPVPKEMHTFKMHSTN